MKPFTKAGCGVFPSWEGLGWVFILVSLMFLFSGFMVVTCVFLFERNQTKRPC
jgi:hypothetical protein